jgi:hypothetical protein
MMTFCWSFNCVGRCGVLVCIFLLSKNLMEQNQNLWRKIISKPTFVSLSSFLLVLIIIPIGVYAFITGEESTKGWAIVVPFIFLMYIGIVYSIDRFLIKHMKLKLLSILEVLLFVICSIAFAYSSREISVNLKQSNNDFVLVVENPGDLVNTEATSASFFNKEFNTTENLIIVSRITTKTSIISRPESWNETNYYNVYTFNKYKKVILFSNPECKMDKKMTELFVDSIIESKLILLE